MMHLGHYGGAKVLPSTCILQLTALMLLVIKSSKDSICNWQHAKHNILHFGWLTTTIHIGKNLAPT